MKHLRKFGSVSAMKAAITASEITIVGLAFDGTTPVSGRKFVVTPPAPSPSTPFYIDVRGPVTLAATSGLQMSTDGKTWTDTTATTLSSGKTYFRVASDQSTPLKPNWTEDNNSDYDIGGNINSLVKVNFEEDTACYSFYISNSGFFKDKTKLKSAGDLILPATILVGSCYSNMFNGCTSLTTAPTLPATRLAARCYENMFQRCTSLTAAPALPATILAGRCYEYMFQGCTSLTTAPALPATTLANNCYEYMFNNCTSLTTAPELPATTLVEGCYNYMFQSCTSLVTAPALPATTLAVGCYYQMFYGCTSLTTAPELPATTLAQNCYGSMFQRCTSLTTASELPATTLVAYCYKDMFNGCTNLNYIKCLATDISATGCLNNWVSGVSSTGTFVKDPNMSSWTTGTSGIPSGWTVKDVGSIFLSQELNVATIKINDLDEGTGYYTINGGSHISIGNGTTTIPITQEINGQVLLAYGEFSGEASEKTLTLSWTDYSPSVTITEANNFVTITSATADTIQYRLGSSGSYTTYTTPVYIPESTTIYVIATRTVSGVVYTTNASEEVTHELTPPTNLVISCAANTVTITADNAATIEYNFDGSSTYTTYTAPFEITQTVTVYAKASNANGSITGSQECVCINYNIPFYIEDISGSENTVQIKKNKSNAPTLTIQKSTDGKTWETMGTTSTTAKTATVPANGKLYLRCTTSYWGGSNTLNNIINTTGNCNVGGNIMSLLYGSSFNGQTEFPTTSSICIFSKLFDSNTHVVNAENLLLPATTLAGNCYMRMFNGCTSLTTAPALPATTLASGCYTSMFYGCTSLNYIKCLATDISAPSCTSGWVSNVSSTGTFVKDPNMSSWTTGVNGIPSGWTVQDATV